MPKTVSTVIFDFDGVLVNTGPDIANATNYTLRKLGVRELPPETIISYIGGGAEPLVRKSLGERADELYEQALPMLLDRYSEHYMEETVLYPGARDVLEHYAQLGKKMGIATNKVEQIAHDIMDHLEIADYFDIVVGPESVTRRKPDPEAVNIILDELDTESADAVMIGDTPADIGAGKAAGTLTCGVTYGFSPAEAIEEAEPDFILDKITEMTDHIR